MPPGGPALLPQQQRQQPPPEQPVSQQGRRKSSLPHVRALASDEKLRAPMLKETAETEAHRLEKEQVESEKQAIVEEHEAEMEDLREQFQEEIAALKAQVVETDVVRDHTAAPAAVQPPPPQQAASYSSSPFEAASYSGDHPTERLPLLQRLSTVESDVTYDGRSYDGRSSVASQLSDRSFSGQSSIDSSRGFFSSADDSQSHEDEEEVVRSLKNGEFRLKVTIFH